jgi:hypothetical protein
VRGLISLDGNSHSGKLPGSGGPTALSKKSNRYSKLVPSPLTNWGPYALTLLTKILK